MSSNEHHHKNINIKSSILNEHFQCGICQGYIIDATTITDCLHSFCKSCIIHFIINIDHMCPTCNSRLKDIKNCIKSDAALQRLIYRMVPSLLDNEIERREKFYQTDSKNEDLLLSKKTYLNLKLIYKNRKKIKIEDKENLKNDNNNNNNNKNDLIQEKYIQCIAQTPIHIITKLLRNKFNLPFNYKVKLTHSGYKLNEDETLLQVFTCFLMNKNDYFEIEYEFNKIKLKSIENTTNVKATTSSTSKASPNKKIKLIKKNDHYLKFKEKRANKPNKQVNFSIKKTDDKKSEIINEKNSVNVTNNTNNVNEQLIDSDQPLDLTINK